jgi:hypothetical protein
MISPSITAATAHASCVLPDAVGPIIANMGDFADVNYFYDCEVIIFKTSAGLLPLKGD